MKSVLRAIYSLGVSATLLAASPLAAQTLPANMYRDSLHAPFEFGVGSFDPTHNSVIIWTAIVPDSSIQDSAILYWAVATDTNLTQLVAQGSAVAAAQWDWTVNVDVAGLQPYAKYYYCFWTPAGDSSVVGRTRTAPFGNHSRARVAAMSCSSIYSGYFNAYRDIGNRSDIDLVVHTGDYIYDFVDEDEETRVPSPYPAVPATTDEWRARHRYYLLDPDLRWARQNHPWLVIWDNHDYDWDTPAKQAEGVRAFQEYVPMRLRSITDSLRAYRKLAYGSLFDFFMIDMDTYRNHGAPADQDTTALGAQQLQWFLNQIDSSSAIWKLIGVQKLFGGWTVPDGIPNVSNSINSSAWERYGAERDSILRFISANAIDNIVFVTGDLHLSMCLDLTLDPQGQGYNPATGEGALGVEFLPTSISRGNLDEMLGTDLFTSIAQVASNAVNPHHVYTQFSNHGYGILDITPDSVTGEIWFFPIQSVSNSSALGVRLKVLEGENHWQRQATSLGNPEPYRVGNFPYWLEVYPNPTETNTTLKIQTFETQEVGFALYQVSSAKQVRSFGRVLCLANQQASVTLNVEGLPAGLYLLEAKGPGFTAYRRLMVGP